MNETIKAQIGSFDHAALTDLQAHIADLLAGESRAIEVGTYNSYNQRRYGRPWAAVISAWNGKPKLDFCGDYLGDDTGGRLEITCQPGDIIRYGQKDNRGNNTENEWAIVADDYTLQATTPADGKDHWRASH